MRVPVPLAWLLLVASFFTAGLLRQYHDRTPSSPFVDPIVGNLLFAACFFLLLVAAREQRRGAVPGSGVRLGSLTPIMLMLLLEKWASLTWYEPLFARIASAFESTAVLDAQFRTFAGVLLLLLCVLCSRFSVPTARKTWRRVRPSRWPVALVYTVAVVVGTYALLGGASMLLGGGLSLHWPAPSKLLLWIVVGQGLLALAEECYYRGLLMSEMERLAPRLGVAAPTVRRWLALSFTAVLFSMEHLGLDIAGDEILRRLVFTVCLGLLLGLLVMISANLHLAAGVHAWINWLLLGAAPYYVDATGQPALPAGTYIGLLLILAFALVYLRQRLRLPPLARLVSAR